MERLTERDESGNAGIIGVDSADLQLNLEFEEFNMVTIALNKFAAYEDAGIIPEQIVFCQDCKFYTDSACWVDCISDRAIKRRKNDFCSCGRRMEDD